jgi:predicted short-subunit dehydrogenase-like oxidoreductase (DUF2520 family)
MEIIIIGSGNVATAMGRKIISAGHRVVQVFSRNRHHAETLAGILHSNAISSLNELDKKAALILIAISDDAFPSFLAGFPGTESLLVHTAGSLPMKILSAGSSRTGVMYPLQSFRRELNTAAEFPLLIDANNEEDLGLLAAFASGLGKTVIRANDSSRMKYHLGGVLVNNFSNHLFALTESWCREEGIDFSLLHPLIRETCSRLELASPRNLQTGPAMRNDRETVKKHLLLLKAYPDLSRLYEMLTSSIRQFHGNDNSPLF